MIYKHLDRVFGLEDFSSSVRFSSQDEAKMFESVPVLTCIKNKKFY